MSTKVTISYEHPHELEAIVRALHLLVDTYKVQPGKTPYKHAYLWMKDIPEDEN